MTTHTGEQDRLIFFSTFRFSVDTFSPHTPLAGGIAMAFIDEVFLLCLPFFLVLGALVSFVALPFRGVGVGVDETHLRLRF